MLVPTPGHRITTYHAAPDSCHLYTLGQAFRMTLQQYGDRDPKGDPGPIQ